MSRSGWISGSTVLGLAVLPVLAACGGSSSTARSAQTGQGLPPAPTPSVTVVVSVSPSPVASSSAPGTAPASTVASSASAAPRAGTGVGLVVDGTGTDLTKPAAPTSVIMTGGGDCYGLLDEGFQKTSCAALGGSKVAAVALVETKRNGSGTEERDLLWTVKGSTGSLALRRVRQLPQGSRYTQGSTATAVDLDGDGVANAAVLTTPDQSAATTSGGGTPLAALDLLTVGGTVSLHRGLHGGVAKQAFGGKGLELWTPRADGKVDHGTFQLKDDRWTLILSEVVGTDKVPSSGLL